MASDQLVKQLHADHINFAKLLDIVASSIQQIEAERSSDFDLLRDVMTYMVRYPDFQHHPVEDLLVAKVVTVIPGLRAMAVRLTTEHRTLAAASTRFLDVLSYVVDGGLVTREDIVLKGRDYIDTLRRHLNWEESEVLPVILEHLSESELAEIDAEFGAMEDPLFGPIRSADFARLWTYINREMDEA